LFTGKLTYTSLLLMFNYSWGGISRSATVIVAYLMFDHAMSVDSAVLLCRRARSLVYPNPGFKNQLYDY